MEIYCITFWLCASSSDSFLFFFQLVGCLTTRTWRRTSCKLMCQTCLRITPTTSGCAIRMITFVLGQETAHRSEPSFNRTFYLNFHLFNVSAFSDTKLGQFIGFTRVLTFKKTLIKGLGSLFSLEVIWSLFLILVITLQHDIKGLTL